MSKTLTGKVRFSYAHVFEPQAAEEGKEPRYSVSIVIPKSDTETIEKIEAAIQQALVDAKSKFPGGKIPKDYWNPLRDGDEDRPDDPTYEDAMFISARSNRKPGIVDANLLRIIDRRGGEAGEDFSGDISPEEFYSGCYGRASLIFYGFNNKSKGVGCALSNLQKLEDGERLGGSDATKDAISDFGSTDDDLM